MFRSLAASHQPRLLIVGAMLALLAPWGGAQNPGEFLLDFSEAELRMILRHGPWPPPASRDPSNRVSGNAGAIAFGEKLFFESRLSAKGSISCGTCHVPQRGWSDGRKLGVGLVEVDRNTPTVQNVRVDGFMPEHNHGMNYKAVVKPAGDGRYDAAGLMFHMPGKWDFIFEVRAAGKTDRMTATVMLQ